MHRSTPLRHPGLPALSPVERILGERAASGLPLPRGEQPLLEREAEVMVRRPPDRSSVVLHVPLNVDDERRRLLHAMAVDAYDACALHPTLVLNTSQCLYDPLDPPAPIARWLQADPRSRRLPAWDCYAREAPLIEVYNECFAGLLARLRRRHRKVVLITLLCHDRGPAVVLHHGGHRTPVSVRRIAEQELSTMEVCASHSDLSRLAIPAALRRTSAGIASIVVSVHTLYLRPTLRPTTLTALVGLLEQVNHLRR